MPFSMPILSTHWNSVKVHYIHIRETVFRSFLNELLLNQNVQVKKKSRATQIPTLTVKMCLHTNLPIVFDDNLITYNNQSHLNMIRITTVPLWTWTQILHLIVYVRRTDTEWNPGTLLTIYFIYTKTIQTMMCTTEVHLNIFFA